MRDQQSVKRKKKKEDQKKHTTKSPTVLHMILFFFSFSLVFFPPCKVLSGLSIAEFHGRFASSDKPSVFTMITSLE